MFVSSIIDTTCGFFQVVFSLVVNIVFCVIKIKGNKHIGGFFTDEPQISRNGIPWSFVFESEKNKLAYDMEIEAIYLLGDFAVKTDGEWEKLDKNAVRYLGTFEINAPKSEVNVKNIELQGYPLLCGEMSLEGEIDICGEKPVLEIDWKGINAVRVKIGDKEKVMLTDNRLQLEDFGISGKTNIEVTIINNLRNILGPHHLKIGESYAVGPWTFFKEKCIWTPSPKNGMKGTASLRREFEKISHYTCIGTSF